MHTSSTLAACNSDLDSCFKALHGQPLQRAQIQFYKWDARPQVTGLSKVYITKTPMLVFAAASIVCLPC